MDYVAPVPTRKARVPAWWRLHADALFGVVLPLGCLVLDPGILRPGWFGSQFGEFAVAVYVFIALSMAALVSWRTWGNAAVLVVGPLFVGALGALAVGIALLPLSLLAVPILIGLLGLVPFGTSVAFFGNARRAWRHACAAHSRVVVLGVSTCLGAGLLAVSAGAQFVVNQRAEALVQAAAAGDAARAERAISRLRLFGPLADGTIGYDAWAYARDEEARGRVYDAWKRATGQELAALID